MKPDEMLPVIKCESKRVTNPEECVFRIQRWGDQTDARLCGHKQRHECPLGELFCIGVCMRICRYYQKSTEKRPTRCYYPILGTVTAEPHRITDKRYDGKLQGLK